MMTCKVLAPAIKSSWFCNQTRVLQYQKVLHELKTAACKACRAGLSRGVPMGRST